MNINYIDQRPITLMEEAERDREGHYKWLDQYMKDMRKWGLTPDIETIRTVCNEIDRLDEKIAKLTDQL